MGLMQPPSPLNRLMRTFFFAQARLNLSSGNGHVLLEEHSSVLLSADVIQLDILSLSLVPLIVDMTEWSVALHGYDLFSRGGKSNRFFNALRFSLEQFCLDADQLIIGIIKNIYFLFFITFFHLLQHSVRLLQST